jgi:hypothetical protein
MQVIKKAKAAHWKEYLDKAREGHLWKAVTYMHLCDDYISIPPLTIGIEEVVDNDIKAKAFLNSFFPKIIDVYTEPECAGSLLGEIY